MVRVTLIAMAMFTSIICFAAENPTITNLEPTPLFPRQAKGQPLQQLVRLHLDNPGEPFAAVARITLGSLTLETQDLGTVAKGESVVVIRLPDITGSKPLKVELLSAAGTVLTVRQEDWKPQKKWTFYCTSYSHHDLGYGDYPHRLRTTIRHANIRLPLQFCNETDSRPSDSQYRFNIETSEPITSFISFYGKDAAQELARRIRERRIEVMGLHNTATTENLSRELLARLFYMSGRYVPDLLEVPMNPTIQHDDVIGMTWPMATYAREAGFDYFFQGYNWICMPNVLPNGKNTEIEDIPLLDDEIGTPIFAIGREPAFFWQGPDGQQIIRRSTTYVRHSIRGDNAEQRIERLIQAHERIHWPFSAILSQDGNDFQLADTYVSNRAQDWNARYAYPRIISSTFSQFFGAVKKEMDNGVKINTISGDENNQWSDQNYAAARFIGKARPLGEMLPVTETLASLSQSLNGKGGQWIDLFQAYHRLLQFFEHTIGKNAPTTDSLEQWRWYETEQVEHGQFVDVAAHFQEQAALHATAGIASAITRRANKNLIVFNPLMQARSDVVRLPSSEIPEGEELVDAGTGSHIPVQRLDDGTTIFLAGQIPAMGYRTYSLEPLRKAHPAKGVLQNQAPQVMENRFYRLQIDPKTGAITSLRDKSLNVELVDANAPHQFNEYLYQRVGDVRKGVSTWHHMEKADSITFKQGPVADVLSITGKAPGVAQLRQSVMIYHDLQRLDFSIWMDKLPFGGDYSNQREGVFVALPFSIAGFTIRHELSGAVVEPYRQQVEGSATDHYAIRSFTDLSNTKYGITLSPVEGALVCYGEPKSAPLVLYHEDTFGRSQKYPEQSRLYLYLMNNMFDTNIPYDQQGPVAFHWALRSHAGDWKTGGASQFGHGVLQPLMAWRADGKNAGSWPVTGSFMSVDAPNVMCSVIKPAEMNGRGWILRLTESIGQATHARISLPFLPKLEAVVETSLVEADRAAQYTIENEHSFVVPLRPFGVKTLRVTCAGDSTAVSNITARAVADMKVELKWNCDNKRVSHYNIYRDTHGNCRPILINLIGQSPTVFYTDRPQVHIGGWLRNTLEPRTTYYYRVVPVDRWNNPGTPSPAAAVTTLAPEQANLAPAQVEDLRAILITKLAKYNAVNLLFYTSCEPDISYYEIHRSESPNFRGSEATRIGKVGNAEMIKGSKEYGKTPIDYPVNKFDHAMFLDTTVKSGTTYYYRVCAVDTAGQHGEFSNPAQVVTKAE